MGTTVLFSSHFSVFATNVWSVYVMTKAGQVTSVPVTLSLYPKTYE